MEDKAGADEIEECQSGIEECQGGGGEGEDGLGGGRGVFGEAGSGGNLARI